MNAFRSSAPGAAGLLAVSRPVNDGAPGRARQQRTPALLGAG